MNSAGGDRGGADEDEEEARRDDFGDQQDHAADQPQPAGFDAARASAFDPRDTGRRGGVPRGLSLGLIRGQRRFAVTERFPRQFADSAERSHQLGRLDREQDGLGVGRGGELADRFDIFLGDEIIDRLGAAAFDRVADRLGRIGFGLSRALARLGFAEGSFLQAFGLQDLCLLLALGAQDFRLRACLRIRGWPRAFRAQPSSGGSWHRRCRAAVGCPSARRG